MNIDISTGHAAGHLDSLNGSRAPVQPPLRARDGLAPAVYPLGGKQSTAGTRNAAGRKISR